MLRSLRLRRLLAAARAPSQAHSQGPAPSRVVVDSVPPLARADRKPWPTRIGDWLAASGWRVGDDSLSALRLRRPEALAAARADFADALADIHTDAAADALDRIAVKRSLHELWHVRAEVFGTIAARHDQSEAARRLAALDRHFPRRVRRAPSPAGDAPER